MRTRVKNRIHGTLARHNAQVKGVTDPFGTEGRRLLKARLPDLPEHTRDAVVQELSTLDFLDAQIKSTEKRLEAILDVSVETDLRFNWSDDVYGTKDLARAWGKS